MKQVRCFTIALLILGVLFIWVMSAAAMQVYILGYGWYPDTEIADGVVAALQGSACSWEVRFFHPSESEMKCQQALADGANLIVAIDPNLAAIAVQQAHGMNIPVVFTSMPDATLGSEELSSGVYGETGGGLSFDPALMIQGLTELSPDIKKVGLMYQRARAQDAHLVEDAALAANLESIAGFMEDFSPGAALAIVDMLSARGVDVIYSLEPSFEALCIFAPRAKDMGIVVAAANPYIDLDQVCPLVALTGGFNYYEHGLLVGDIVRRIVAGEDPSMIPVVRQTPVICVNRELLESLGYQVSDSFIEYLAVSMRTKTFQIEITGGCSTIKKQEKRHTHNLTLKLENLSGKDRNFTVKVTAGALKGKLQDEAGNALADVGTVSGNIKVAAHSSVDLNVLLTIPARTTGNYTVKVYVTDITSDPYVKGWASCSLQIED